MTDIRDLLKTAEPIDEKSWKILTRVIASNNLPEFDYLEFLASVEKLKAMDMDEQTAMKSAFSTASAFGLTKDKLVQTAKHYIATLHGEYDSFKGALQKHINEKITTPQSKVEKLQKEHDSIDQQIEDLIKKKAFLAETIANKKMAIHSDTEALKEKEAKFNTAVKALSGRIQEDIDRFNTIL